jgi:glutathionyl-hydroquinone reductase
MGFSISWLAIRGAKALSALSQLGLEETDSRELVPESPVSAVTLETGWYVIFFNDASPAALQPEVLRRLSQLSTVVTCQVEEHAMVSTAAEWQDGKEVWYVMHDAEDGPTNLDSVGQLPSSFESVRNAQLAKNSSANVDYVFDVPVMLAQEITGFRHDDFLESEDGRFTVLRPCP